MNGIASMMRRIIASPMRVIFVILVTALLFFIFYPLFKMVISASPTALFEALREAEVSRALWLTFYAALFATVVGFICGIPLAYLLGVKEFMSLDISLEESFLITRPETEILVETT